MLAGHLVWMAADRLPRDPFSPETHLCHTFDDDRHQHREHKPNRSRSRTPVDVPVNVVNRCDKKHLR
ncbi:hypothetical protein LSAT2_004348 [Lamellibrachia satsuma]|nr:hypothetical protein LSAT2_004348 [Lamellibrachia satsuma]